MIMELSKDLADALLIYTASIKDEDKRKAFLEGSKRWQQRRYREIYIKEAQSVYPLSIKVFDTNPYLFNCDNATIDFSTGRAKEHSHLDYITMLSPVKYDPEAYSERFIRFIDEVTSRDNARARFLQKSLGYARNFNLELRKFGDVQRKRPRTGGEKTTLLMGYILKDDFLSDPNS